MVEKSIKNVKERVGTIPAVGGTLAPLGRIGALKHKYQLVLTYSVSYRLLQ